MRIILQNDILNSQNVKVKDDLCGFFVYLGNIGNKMFKNLTKFSWALYTICMMAAIVRIEINLTNKSHVIYCDLWETLKQFTN